MAYKSRGQSTAEVGDSNLGNKPYSKPALTCYDDIRSVTLGGSLDPGETSGFFAPGDQGFTGENTFSRSESGSDSSSRGRSRQ